MEKHKDLLRHNIRQYGMLFALIAIVLIFQILTGGILLRPINVTRLILQNSYILILAVGMMLCILTGGHIDLSVGSIDCSNGGCIICLIQCQDGSAAPLSIFWDCLVGLLAGMWQGSGLPLSKPPFIVTLRECLYSTYNNIILNGQTVLLPKLYITIASDSIPDFFSGNGLHYTTVIIGFFCSILYVIVKFIIRTSKIKNGFDVNSKQWFLGKLALVVLIINLFTYWLARANGLPYIVILLTVIIAVYSFITNKTVAGRHIYALGGNAKAAELSGINTRRVMFWVYANMGFWLPGWNCFCRKAELCISYWGKALNWILLLPALLEVLRQPEVLEQLLVQSLVVSSWV